MIKLLGIFDILADRLIDKLPLLINNLTPVFLNQMMRFKENYPSLQQVLEELFPGACFWEGVCTVSGTINGISVNGKSDVELTHYYDSVEK